MSPFLFCLALLFTIPAFAEESATAPAKGKPLNPDISANLLGLYQRGTALGDNRNVPPYNGFSLQEAEMQFTADVDPYFRASALFSVAQQSGSTDYGIDPEEVYLETIFLPGVTLRGGKFKLQMGQHNQLHTHAFPFINAPLINEQLFGDEGLNEVGISGAVLLPVSWYSEFVVQAFGPSNANLYGSVNSADVGGLGHFKNLWDLNDDLTAELGFSGTAGKNAQNLTSTAYGADLTFKWRPSVGGKYRALIWQTEYLNGFRGGLVDSTTGEPIERLGGLASWLQYQFAERWWVQARGEKLGLPTSAVLPSQSRVSGLLGFFPSEFSGFRMQYDRLSTEGAATAEHTFSLQYNVSIGAHPAHAY